MSISAGGVAYVDWVLAEGRYRTDLKTLMDATFIWPWRRDRLLAITAAGEATYYGEGTWQDYLVASAGASPEWGYALSEAWRAFREAL